MEEYIDEMLHLTADIAEELLTVKDTGECLSDITAEKIARLAELAVSSRINYKPSPAATEATTAQPDEAEEMADIEQSTALKGIADEKAEQISEIARPDIAGDIIAQSNADDQAIASNALYEESNDALPDNKSERFASAPSISARDLRNAMTLNDVFLYQRMLFNGSPTLFKQALEEIATLSSTEQLKSYLANVHHVDLNEPEAEAFVATVGALINQ